MNNFNNEVDLLLKATQSVALNFNHNLEISIETTYISELNDDCKGIFIKLCSQDDAGLFIAVHGENTTVFSSFLPKLDSGDNSVGLSEHYYNSFEEDHESDFQNTNIQEAAIQSIFALIELYLKPQIDSLLEYESLKNLNELEGEY